MSIIQRNADLIQVPVLQGQVVFLDQHEDVIKASMRLILRVAIEVEGAGPLMSLQKLEKINFNITGARWGVGDSGVVSVSLYPQRPETAIKIQAGSAKPIDLSIALSTQNRIKEVIEGLARRDCDYNVVWE